MALRACARRGAAIDVVCDRGREQRSQIVFTRARGREVVFWQSPRTRKQARPDVRLPTARAQRVADLEILVDSHERYPYTFASQQARTVRRGLSCGDYAVTVQGQIVAAVERKSVADLVSSLTSGRLRYALGELSALLRAAVVVEEHYGQIFAVEHVRGSVVADGLAELQIRWPMVPIVFCQTRKPAEEWTYRYLAAAHAWARDEPAVHARRASRTKQNSSRDPSRGRRPANCARGRATTGSLSQTAAACDPRFTKHGATLTVLRARELASPRSVLSSGVS